MNERKAIYRQLQHYFEMSLFGMYRWGDVQHRDPEPVAIERDDRGRRINQKSFGRFAEKVVVEFDGYVLVVLSPNECEPDAPARGAERQTPKPAVMLYDGPARPDNVVVQGANINETWKQVTELLRRNLHEGKKDHGSSQRSSGW